MPYEVWSSLKKTGGFTRHSRRTPRPPYVSFPANQKYDVVFRFDSIDAARDLAFDVAKDKKGLINVAPVTECDVGVYEHTGTIPATDPVVLFRVRKSKGSGHMHEVNLTRARKPRAKKVPEGQVDMFPTEKS